MSIQTKTRAQKAGKFLGIALFAFLMFFTFNISFSDSGVDLSVSSNDVQAELASPCHFIMVEINEFVWCSTTRGNCCGVVVVTG
jgi:hypothetical protein